MFGVNCRQVGWPAKNYWTNSERSDLKSVAKYSTPFHQYHSHQVPQRFIINQKALNQPKIRPPHHHHLHQEDFYRLSAKGNQKSFSSTTTFFLSCSQYLARTNNPSYNIVTFPSPSGFQSIKYTVQSQFLRHVTLYLSNDIDHAGLLRYPHSLGCRDRDANPKHCHYSQTSCDQSTQPFLHMV